MRTSLMLIALMLISGCPTTAPEGGVPNTAPADPPPPGLGEPTEDVRVEPGTGVMVSGVFTYTGDAEGVFRVDIASPQPSGPPRVVTKTVVPEAGPWEVELPKNLGPIIVTGFVEQGHGPGPTTPNATVYGLTVGETPLVDIVIAPAVPGVVVGSPPIVTSAPAGTTTLEGTAPVGDGTPPTGTPPTGAPLEGTAPTGPGSTPPPDEAAPVPADPAAAPAGTATPVSTGTPAAGTAAPKATPATPKP